MGQEGPQGAKGEDGRDAELPDLSEYVKKSELPSETTDLSEYAKKSELPDVSNLLTEYQADAKYVLNSDLSTYARKTDIPQPQDLSEYAKKSEIVEPDLEPYETKEHAEQTYANKSELPDLSIYALKSELGSDANLSDEDILKILTIIQTNIYTDFDCKYINVTDKAVNLTFDAYGGKGIPEEKTITIQPKESFEMYVDDYNPIVYTPTPENNYKDSVKITYTDGSKVGFRDFPIAKFLKRGGLLSRLNAANKFQNEQYEFIRKDSLAEQKSPYDSLFFVDTKPVGVKPYIRDKPVIQDRFNDSKNKYWMNGSTIKILYDNAISTNGDLSYKLNTETTVAINGDRSVFYNGFLKGVYDAETGDNVTNGFNNKSVIVVFEITDPRYGLI